MPSGRVYRAASVGGTVAATALAVLVANHPTVQTFVATTVPLLSRLPATVLRGDELLLGGATTVGVVVVALAPLYKPRPRRILDAASLAARRVVLATVVLAAVGYFDYTYRLPRTTLVVVAAVLAATLPPYFVLLRRAPTESADRTVVVGDDAATVAAVVADLDRPLVGYVAPPRAQPDGAGTGVPDRGVDGSPTGVAQGVGSDDDPLADLPRLGGFSRLEDVLVETDADAAVVAFSRPDRAEFFGVLDACYEHGVAVRAPRDHAHTVLTDDPGGDLVDVDVEPWDPQDYALKRAFDVVFALGVLLVLAPVLVAVAAAVRREDGGPVLYGQRRTAALGETFEVYKFRTMVPDAEAEVGPTVSPEDAGGTDPRVTRVGRVLRRTHLDEVPQLWSILVGDMSVVGPRPERPALDADIERETADWRRRWFVKPGLTGLAQVRGATGADPQEKLRYDLQYIRRQSFRLDLKIVVRQLWLVALDCRDLFRESLGR